jgi:ATP-dependent DNA helicase RecG
MERLIDPNNPLDFLKELMTLRSEVEWVEFKEAKTTFDFEDLGKYFSAISNEANLNGKTAGWLVFGVTNTPPRKIIGSNYCLIPPGLDDLKSKISLQTNHQMTFSNIYELDTIEGRVILFEIPPATRGIPTEWKGYVYGRIQDSRYPLALHEIDKIRSQGAIQDWSAKICETANINDLNLDAISFARQKFKEKNPDLFDEVERWSNIEFLNRAGLCIKGKITYASLILLGKEESQHYLSPATVQITWVLKDASGFEIDYAHFGLPIILAVDKIFAKIRNLTYRYTSDETLFPLEISRYDTWVIRETLHNCIAHQDYPQGAKITIVEGQDYLLFTNRGEFIPGSIETVLTHDAPPDKYRNPFLAKAMVNLKMIDTIGSGIRRMFLHQRERNFPLPDFDLNEFSKVKVKIIGRVIDSKYTRMLIRNKDLAFPDVIALDKVQKGKPITDIEFRSLKSMGLIEGRRPHLYISENVAKDTDSRADYIRKRSFDKGFFKKMVLEYLITFGEADRKEIDKLLFNKVSDALSEDQKRLFIKNLLQHMRKEGTITTSGKTFGARWVLSKRSK